MILTNTPGRKGESGDPSVLHFVKILGETACQDRLWRAMPINKGPLTAPEDAAGQAGWIKNSQKWGSDPLSTLNSGIILLRILFLNAKCSHLTPHHTFSHNFSVNRVLEHGIISISKEQNALPVCISIDIHTISIPLKEKSGIPLA